MNVGVDARPAVRLPSPGDDARRDAVNRRAGKAPADFAPHLRFEPAIETGMLEPRRERKSSAAQQVTSTDDEGHRQRRQRDGERGAHAGALAVPSPSGRCI